MPRSPTGGAYTRSASHIEFPAHLAVRETRLRQGEDRRTRDAGPPNGVERRGADRRLSDRRRGAERRTAVRRLDGSSPQSGLGMRGTIRPATAPIPRVASREHGPLRRPTSQLPRVLRVLALMLLAIGCLLAATLQDADAATGKTGALVKRSGAVTASLSYVRAGSPETGAQFKQLVLTVRAPGRTTLRRLRLTGAAGTAFLTRPRVKVVDVTADGTPDVIVDVYTGGAHCCTVSTIVRSTPKGWGNRLVRNWADHSYELRDLGGSATPEFLTDDQRFTGTYAAYALSASPIQIWSMEGGPIVDVTRQFPDWIRKDITAQQQMWQDVAKESDPGIVADGGRAAAAAWIADLALLGEFDAAKAVYAAASARGDFGPFPGFGGQLGHDLKAWGYLSDPALIGLTDAPVS